MRLGAKTRARREESSVRCPIKKSSRMHYMAGKEGEGEQVWFWWEDSCRGSSANDLATRASQPRPSSTITTTTTTKAYTNYHTHHTTTSPATSAPSLPPPLRHAQHSKIEVAASTARKQTPSTATGAASQQ